MTLAELRLDGRLATHTGPLDIALGAIGTEETWQMAALGACDSRWALALEQLASLRAGTGTTYLRFAPEMNGHWHPWSVGPQDRQHFVTAWHRWRTLQRAHFPDALAVFCPAHRSTQPYDWTTLLPPAQDVDILGVAFHPDQLPYTKADLTHLLHEVDQHGGPVGPEAFRCAAQALGVPFALGEWSNISANGPSPLLAKSLTHATTALHGTGPGQIAYAIALTFPAP